MNCKTLTVGLKQWRSLIAFLSSSRILTKKARFCFGMHVFCARSKRYLLWEAQICSGLHVISARRQGSPLGSRDHLWEASISKRYLLWEAHICSGMPVISPRRQWSPLGSRDPLSEASISCKMHVMQMMHKSIWCQAISLQVVCVKAGRSGDFLRKGRLLSRKKLK